MGFQSQFNLVGDIERVSLLFKIFGLLLLFMQNVVTFQVWEVGQNRDSKEKK